jgi:hypothetical protein
MKPTAFIASSSERREIADTLQELLDAQQIEATVWNQGVLRPSSQPSPSKGEGAVLQRLRSP